MSVHMPKHMPIAHRLVVLDDKVLDSVAALAPSCARGMLLTELFKVLGESGSAVVLLRNNASCILKSKSAVAAVSKELDTTDGKTLFCVLACSEGDSTSATTRGRRGRIFAGAGKHPTQYPAQQAIPVTHVETRVYTHVCTHRQAAGGRNVDGT